ncbi:MAG TPA: fatty acid desaturase [Rhizomicrobium sp.]|jgi:beta-carotene hydroxylase
MDPEAFQELAMAGEAPLAGPAADDFLTRARAFERRARSVVQPLTNGFPWPTLFIFLGVLAGVSSIGLLGATGRLSWWIAVPLNAILIYFIFTPLHEATHGNIAGRERRRVWVENLIGHVSGFVLLAPFPGFRVLHLHHHANTNDPAEDPDYWIRSPTWIGQAARSLVIQPVYILHLWRIARDPRTMRAFVWEMMYVFSYLAIIFAAFRLGIGKQLLLAWILPGYIGVVLCPMMFDWPVHHPHMERGRYTDSAILLFPKPIRALMDFVFCGHTYHLMHHLYPRVPFYRYGAAWFALKDELLTLEPKVRTF